jgi:hypothetical protein
MCHDQNVWLSKTGMTCSVVNMLVSACMDGNGMCLGQNVCFSMFGMYLGQNVDLSMAGMCCACGQKH